jgi:hypothetical protein
MNHIAVLLLTTTLAASAAVRAEEAVSSTTLRRIALLVSANDGGVGRPRLRWTGDDARAMGLCSRNLAVWMRATCTT